MRRLGDVLLATVLIRSVRRAWPQARLEVLVNSGSASVLEGNPDIDRLWQLSDRAGAVETLRLLAALCRRYDLAVSALYNDRPHIWALVASGHRVAVVPPKGHPGAFWKRWLTHEWCELELGVVHAVEQYLRIADAMGVAPETEVVPPRPAPAAMPRPPVPPYVVVHPAPLYRYKAWTIEGWQALLRHLIGRGFEVRLTGGPAAADRALGRSIVEGLNGVERGSVHELAGQGSFADLTPLIEGARLFVGPDTSVTHLAAATGTPTIALFGPTPPVAWGPWPVRWHAREAGSPWQTKLPLQRRGNVWLVQGAGDCVPCGREGCDRHLNSHSSCLDELSAERVIGVVEQVLAEPAATLAGGGAGGAGVTGRVAKA